MTTEQTMQNHTQTVETLYCLLVQFGWTKLDVGVALMHFAESQGDEAIAALLRYIEYAKAHNHETGSIAATVGHDLNGCRNECFSPRSSGY